MSAIFESDDAFADSVDEVFHTDPQPVDLDHVPTDELVEFICEQRHLGIAEVLGFALRYLQTQLHLSGTLVDELTELLHEQSHLDFSYLLGFALKFLQISRYQEDVLHRVAFAVQQTFSKLPLL
jgi:hypothetical protein